MMKVLPTLSEAMEIAANGKYDVLPLSCELLSDFTTPIEAMRILKAYRRTATCSNPLRQTTDGDDTPSSALTRKWKSPASTAK